MSGIRSTGRVGSTSFPNWRFEDQDLDTYQLRIACWLVTHTNTWREDHVTRNKIAERTGVSQGKVSSSVERLTELGIINVETIDVSQSKGGRRWVITVHLDVWETKPVPRSCGDQAPGHGVTTPGHGVTATKGSTDEVKRTQNPPYPPTGGTEVVPFLLSFDDWYATYPQKQGKATAKKRWAKMTNDERQACVDAQPQWNAYWQAKGEAQFIPHASTFLNQRRWEDEVPVGHQRRPTSVAEKNAAISTAMQEGARAPTNSMLTRMRERNQQ